MQIEKSNKNATRKYIAFDSWGQQILKSKVNPKLSPIDAIARMRLR